jgi:hypothetical protein
MHLRRRTPAARRHGRSSIGRILGGGALIVTGAAAAGLAIGRARDARRPLSLERLRSALAGLTRRSGLSRTGRGARGAGLLARVAPDGTAPGRSLRRRVLLAAATGLAGRLARVTADRLAGSPPPPSRIPPSVAGGGGPGDAERLRAALEVRHSAFAGAAAGASTAVPAISAAAAPAAVDDARPPATKTGKALRGVRLALLFALLLVIIGAGLGIADWKFRIFNLFRGKDALVLFAYLDEAHRLAPDSTVVLDDIEVGAIRSVELVKAADGTPQVRVKIGVSAKGAPFVVAGTKAKVDPQLVGPPRLALVPPTATASVDLARNGEVLDVVPVKSATESTTEAVDKIMGELPGVVASVKRTLDNVRDASGSLPDVADQVDAAAADTNDSLERAERRPPISWLTGKKGPPPSEFEAVPGEGARR